MEILLPVIVSLLAQMLKQKVKKDWQRIGIVVFLSLVAATVYAILKSYGFWEAFMGIFVTAGAIYAYIIRRFEK